MEKIMEYLKNEKNKALNQDQAITVIWLPVNTFTFLLAPEFRVISGALLAVVLGFILGIVRKKEIN